MRSVNAVKEDLHESICVEGKGGGQARAIGGRIKKPALPAPVAKTPMELIGGTVAT